MQQGCTTPGHDALFHSRKSCVLGVLYPELPVLQLYLCRSAHLQGKTSIKGMELLTDPDEAQRQLLTQMRPALQCPVWLIVQHFPQHRQCGSGSTLCQSLRNMRTTHLDDGHATGKLGYPL